MKDIRPGKIDATWHRAVLDDNITLATVHHTLAKLGMLIQTKVSMMIRLAGSRICPRESVLLYEMATDKDGIVDSELIHVIEYVAKTHKKIFGMMLQCGLVTMLRSGQKREFGLCCDSELSAPLIDVACVALEDLIARRQSGPSTDVPQEATVAGFAQTCGGTVECGTKWLTRRMYLSNPGDVIAGIRAAGGNCGVKYTPQNTVGLQSYVGLTWRQVARLAQVLCRFNGGSSVLASYKSCRLLRAPREVQYQYHTYSRTEASSESGTERIVTLDYRVANPFDVTQVALTNLRDGPQQELLDGAVYGIGRMFGTCGKAVGCTLYGDHGGTDMRFMLSLLALPGTAIDASTNIASFRGKESYSLIQNTVATVINEGLEALAITTVLVLQWTEPVLGFDFLMVLRAGLQVNDISLTRSVDTGEMCATWKVDGLENTAVFERKDIPQVYDVVLLSVERFLCMDLAMVATAQGRPTYASARCPLCDLLHSDKAGGHDWQQCRGCGGELTVGRFQETIDEYKRTHIAEAPVSKAVRAAAEKASEQLGLTTLSPLFPSLPVDRIILPVLHECLGVVLILFNRLYEFVEAELEVEPAPLQHQRAALQAKTQGLVQTNTAIAALSAQQAITPHAAALPAQRAALQEEKRTQKEGIRAAKAEIDRLRRSDKGYFKMSNALDKIFAEHHIQRTEYSSHSLVGCHCATFLEDWPLILPKVSELFKSPQRRAHTPPSLNDDIDAFLGSMSVAVEAMYVIRLYMYSSTVLNEAELKNFKDLCVFFVNEFRSNPWLKRSITPKMHLLESHAPEQMVQFGGCLSQFLEEDIEREHRVCKKLNMQYNLVTDWECREKCILKRIQKENLPSTRSFKFDMQVGTKRTFQADSLDRRAQKRGAVVESKQDRIGGIMLKVNEANESR